MIDFRRVFQASWRLFALTTAFAVAPALAQADCPQWDVSGYWSFVQSNGTTPGFTLQQTGTELHGNGSYHYTTEHSAWVIGTVVDDHAADGPAVGKIIGNAFELTVYWNNNTIGVYTGQIGAQGLIVGNAFDRNNPETTAQWHSDRFATCLSNAGAAAAPTPPPVKAQSRVQIPETPVTSTMNVCESAAVARARNSPAAPGLEAKCAAQAPPPVKAQSRVQLPETSVTSTTNVCESAAAARARNSPAAPGLEAKCAAQASKPAPPLTPAPGNNTATPAGKGDSMGKVSVAVGAGDVVEGPAGGSTIISVRLLIPCLSGCRYRFSLASATGNEIDGIVLTSTGSNPPGLPEVDGKATYFGKANPAGSVQQFLYAQVLGDDQVEPDEKFQIRVEDLNQPKTAEGYPSYLLFAGTIKNDDGVQDSLAAKGEALAMQDPLAAELRNLQPEGPVRRGFDIGMAVWEGNTLQGTGKQRALASLASVEEQEGFLNAEAFSMQRNPNAELAAKGAIIALLDPAVAEARDAESDIYYKLGFDIATGIFGDPVRGALGNTAVGPSSVRIRDSLTAEYAQWGFDAATTYHLGRRYH